MPRERQVAFSGGELSPALHGRTDLDRYALGAKTIKNMVVTPEGILKTRTGTQYIKAPPGLTEAALIPFRYSETGALVLLFGNFWMRVYEADTDYTWNEYAVFSSPFADDYVADLRYVQNGDDLYVTSAQYGLYRVRRVTNSDWEFEAISFSDWSFPVPAGAPSSDYLPEEPKLRVDYMSTFPPSGQSEYRNYAKDLPFGVPDRVVNWEDLVGGREWRWKLSLVLRDSNGVVRETIGHTITKWQLTGTENADIRQLGTSALTYPNPDDPMETGIPKILHDDIVVGMATWGPYTILGGEASAWVAAYLGYNLHQTGVARSAINDDTGAADWPVWSIPAEDQWLIGSDRPVKVWSPYVEGDTVTDGATGETYTVVASRVYRGAGDLFGYVGEMRVNTFVDEGSLPDYRRPPPDGSSRLTINNVTQKPQVVAFYEGRLYLANSSSYPNRVWGSKVDEFTRHQRNELALDADALEFDLLSNLYEQVVALLPRRQLVALTTSHQWGVAGGGESNLLTPNSIAARIRSTVGAAFNPAPLSVKDDIWFLQQKGTTPRIAAPDPQTGEMVIADASLYSRHLFDGHTIVDWAYAEEPHSLVWCVRDDGIVLACTYIPGQRMMAWTVHDFRNDPDDKVERVAVIPEGVQDAVYFVVQRQLAFGQTFRTVERMSYDTLPTRTVEKVTTDTVGTVIRTDYDVRPDLRYAVNMDLAETYDGAIGKEVTFTGQQRAADSVRLYFYDHPTSGNFWEDRTSAAANATNNDVDFVDTVTGVRTATRVLFGDADQFNKIVVDWANGTESSGLSADYAEPRWCYYDGELGDWAPLEDVTDETDYFTADKGDGQEITFKIPERWAMSDEASTGTLRWEISLRFEDNGDDVGGWQDGLLLDQVFIETTGALGEIVTATFDDYTGQDGVVVQVDDPRGGQPVRVLLSNGVGSVYDAQVVSAPGSGLDGRSGIPSWMFGVAIDSGLFACAESITGVHHLEGLTVSALVDGNVVSDLVVDGGVVSVADHADYGGGAVITVGIPYECDLETLPAINERNRQKVVRKVHLELDRSRGGSVGTSLDDLIEIEDRSPGDDYLPPAFERRDVDVVIRDVWEAKGAIAYRQDQPLPASILGVERVYELGGD